MKAIDVEQVWVTGHAIDRMGDDYPDVSIRAARGILNRSIELDGDTVQPVLGRGRGHHKKRAPSRYFLPPERQGILVLEEVTREGAMPWSLVTYLRLERSQQALVDRLWPREAA